MINERKKGYMQLHACIIIMIVLCCYVTDLSILPVTGQLALNCNDWFLCSSIGGR